MNRHTTARRGKRVHVVLHGGRRFTDKLEDMRSRYFQFEREGRVAKHAVRSFSLAGTTRRKPA